MPAKTVKLQRLHLILMGLLFFSLLGALLMSSDALQTSTRFDHLYSPLLAVSGTGLVVLVGLILLNLRQLVRQVRLRRAGARLTVRLVVVFAILASAPVLIVYYFSLEFLHQRLDSWFDVKIEHALGDALELSRLALDDQMRSALQQTLRVAEAIEPGDQKLAALQLGELREQSGSTEISLVAANGRIIAFNSSDISQLLPNRPPDEMVLKLKPQPELRERAAQAETTERKALSDTDGIQEIGVYNALEEPLINLESVEGRGLSIRVVVPCPLPAGGKDAHSMREGCTLHALFPVKERLSALAKQVEEALEAYQKLNFLRMPLKASFTLVLSLVLLLAIFSAVWVAFFSARRLVAPIRDLAEATRAVAAGNYNTQLPVGSLDELGFLVQSFNEMTYKIRIAQDDVQRSRQIADAQRAYLETVLERLSSGVLSLDHKHRLRTANSAAEQILEIPLSELRGQSFRQLCKANPPLLPLCEAVENHRPKKGDSQATWQAQITVFSNNGRKILMCRGKSLPGAEDVPESPRYSGHVLVFDDITALIQAQRTAAWSEVAQRVAHEIKNPLTPIQLSAERLRHKYLPSFPDKEADVLDRMTHTIIQQVEALKEMVNNFNDYARPPQLKLQPVQLNRIVDEVLDLYRYQEQRIFTDLADELPDLYADVGRLRQILHNLLKNALEATPDGTVVLRTLNDGSGFVELQVRDQGPGFDPDLLDRIFEPYITSKPRGSGLGLAIVKKIVEEHGGMVSAHNNDGACVTLHFPVPVASGAPSATREAPAALETSQTTVEYA